MEIKTIGVIGAGQMGRGIAQNAAMVGYTVLLADVEESFAKSGVERIRKDLEKLVEKGKIPASDKDTWLSRIQVVKGVEAFSSAQLAIEAVTENVELKQDLFKKLDEIIPREGILASNTSSISITKLAAATKRPEQVIGMHFFNPVPVMKVLEVVRALQTSDSTFFIAKAVGEKLGKTVVVSKDAPGFMVNRLLMPFLNVAAVVFQEGVGTAEDIDTAVKLGLNHPMGPLELADFIGLDTCLHVSELLHRELGDARYSPAPLLRTYVSAGWLGRKTGRGFYRYDK